MNTQIMYAQKGVITDEMYQVAKDECCNPEMVKQRILEGRVVILKNNKKTDINPVAIGEGMRIKTLSSVSKTMTEIPFSTILDKTRVIEQAGADILVDVSFSAPFDELRQAILSAIKIPFGTFPVIQSGVEVLAKDNSIEELSKDAMLADIEKHCADGVDFVMLNCGVTKYNVEQFEKQQRLANNLSFSSAILASYIKATGKENPLYENFNELLDILKSYDVTLCLSAGFKTHSVIDANDRVQHSEMITLGDLAQRARKFGVQTAIEGIGHVPLNMVSAIVQTTKELTDYAPLIASDMLACDCALGYDNLTSSIIGANAAYCGVDVLSCPANVDSIRQANSAQIREGIMSAKIAAHCADLARGNKSALDKNIKMSIAKSNLDWNRQKENALDKKIFEKNSSMSEYDMYCVKLMQKYFKV